MKANILLYLAIFSSQIIEGQKIYTTFSNEICNCLTKGVKQDVEHDPKLLINKCFENVITKYYKELSKEYGDDFFDNTKNQKAYNFGLEIGKILIEDCESYKNIFVDQANEKNNKSKVYFDQAEEDYKNELYDDAITNYNMAISIEANNANYYNSRGAAYYAKENYYKAIADFMNAIDFKPDYYIAYFNLSKSKYKMNDFNGALADINKSISIDPIYCESHNQKGLIFNNLDYIDSAIFCFKEAFYCDSLILNYSYNVGFMFYTKKDYSQALEWYNKSFLMGNTSNTLISYIGNCYDNLGDYPKAIVFHTKNIQNNDGTNYIPYYNRGIALYNNGDYNLALADFTTALNIDSTDVDIIYYLAKTNENLKNSETAEYFYNRAITMTPDNAGYYDNRAAFYETQKKYDLAIRDYTVSLSLYPEDCKIHLLIGKVYLLSGNIDKGNESFKKSLEYGCPEAEEFLNK